MSAFTRLESVRPYARGGEPEAIHVILARVEAVQPEGYEIGGARHRALKVVLRSGGHIVVKDSVENRRRLGVTE